MPEVVCYKGNAVSYQIARRLVKIKYISLVNLVMDQELVKELIQHDFSAAKVKAELSKILETDRYNEIRMGYDELRQRLGGTGASAKAAAIIIGEAS